MRSLFAGLILGLAPLFALAGPIDINVADAVTIAAELDGVGLSRAQAIVDYRDKHGLFVEPRDIMNVKGVGPQIFEANRKNILINRDG